MTPAQAAQRIRAAARARQQLGAAPSSSSSASSAPPWHQRIPWGKVALGVGLLAAAAYVFRGERGEEDNPGDDEAARLYTRFHWGRKPTRNKRVQVSPTPRRLVELGTLEAVTYAARKGTEGLVDYIHHFGEGGGRKPKLAADPRNRRLHIVGGSYDVKSAGITG